MEMDLVRRLKLLKYIDPLQKTSEQSLEGIITALATFFHVNKLLPVTVRPLQRALEEGYQVMCQKPADQWRPDDNK
eukprot:6354970-Amphidinium_carterae.1